MTTPSTQSTLKPSDMSLDEEILLECTSMAKYAFASGKKVPGSVAQAIEDFIDKESNQTNPSDYDTNELAKIHGQLVDIVAPATPRTLLYMERQAAKGGFLKILPVPLVRWLMLATVISIVILIGTSLSPNVNGDLEWQTESGWALLLEELFVMSAAGIGACFFLLFQVSSYIREGTYDPAFNATYWIRFVLGIIAGLTLAMLIPLKSDSALGEFTKPTLAMLGGFSVAVVYRILVRLVDTVESLFRADTRDVLAAQEQTSQARYAEQEARNRIQIATKLTRLQQQIGDSPDPQALRAQLDAILNDIVPLEEEETPASKSDATEEQKPKSS
jgi:hypothetical protein